MVKGSGIFLHESKEILYEYGSLDRFNSHGGIAIRIHLDPDNPITSVMEVKSFVSRKVNDQIYPVDPVISIDVDKLHSQYGVEFPHRIIQASKPIKYVKVIGWFDDVSNVLEKNETKIGWFLFPSHIDESISEDSIRKSIENMLIKINELAVKLL